MKNTYITFKGNYSKFSKMNNESIYNKGEFQNKTANFSTLKNNFSFFFLGVGHKGGRVDLGGVGSEWDWGTVYKICKEVIKNIILGKTNYY